MPQEDKLTRVYRAREGGHVERCHTVPHVGTYKVSEHTAQMLFLLDVLYPSATLRLWRAVLHHDLSEAITGDVPGGVGKVDPELRKVYEEATEVISEEFGWGDEDLTDHERRWLAALDKLELYLWCHDQANLGNDHAAPIMEFLEQWFFDRRNELPQNVRKFLAKYEWRRVSGR